ncbi:unnamed protein product [Cylindrotheca closterium]|uniref:Uncharacterized protein n=1 Tax=Cylindrotheca closterium TaxID=2856 RepID=A0AAD2JN85_9STRA|nr:unnamed protein product [Cylindrotheca closterium]
MERYHSSNNRESRKNPFREEMKRSNKASSATERKKLEIIEAHERLTKLSGHYEVCIANIRNKLNEYQEIVESIDHMIQSVRLEKEDLKEKLMERNNVAANPTITI